MIAALLSKFQGYQPAHREITAKAQQTAYCVFFDLSIGQSPEPFCDDITQSRCRLWEMPRLLKGNRGILWNVIAMVFPADFEAGLGMVADRAGFGGLGAHHPGDLFAPDPAVRI